MNAKVKCRLHSGLIVGFFLALSTVFLAGCAETESAGTEADSITMTDAWVKAVPKSDMMTGAFGVLTNSSDQDIAIASIEAAEIAGKAEQHEMVMGDGSAMVMKAVESGHVIPAGGQLALEPGGNHFMLMQLKRDLVAGEMVTFVLTFEDGSTLSVDAQVKDYTGANEEYQED